MNLALALTSASSRLRLQSASPRLDAEVLLAWILRRDRAWLLTHPESNLSLPQQRRYLRLIADRRRGMPIPYLTGHAAFAGHDFLITPGVLVPRPFTELLIEAVLPYISEEQPALIADIGTGSGCIAITIAFARPKATIVASDVSPVALKLCRRNVRRFQLGQRINVRRGPLTAAWLQAPSVLIANLPYLAPNQLREPSLRREPKVALAGGGRQGLNLIKQLLAELSRWPSVTTVALELDPHQVESVRRLLRRWSPTCRLLTVSDGRSIRGLLATTITPR